MSNRLMEMRMKFRLISFILGMGMLQAAIGCEMGGAAKIEPSPAYPTLGKSRPSRFQTSTLRVFTETWIDYNLGSGDTGTVIRPSAYTLYDDQGRKLFFVRNYIGATDREPETIELDPGRYLVLLDEPGKHPPVFWVLLEPGKETVVDLLRSGK